WIRSHAETKTDADHPAKRFSHRRCARSAADASTPRRRPWPVSAGRMNPLADLSNELLAGMLTHGYTVLALVLVLAAIGVPLPASLVATVAGTLLAEGELDLVPTLVVAVGACLVGDMAGFGIGRLGGREIARRHGRWFGIGATRMYEAEALFRRW